MASIRVSYKLTQQEFEVFDKFVSDLNASGEGGMLSHERVAKQSLFRTIEAAYRTQEQIDAERREIQPTVDVPLSESQEVSSPAHTEETQGDTAGDRT